MSPSFSFCKLMLAVGSSLCGFAYAQVAVSMDEVVITGSATPSKNSSPAPAERLGGDALLVRPSSSLGETLSGLAGVGSSYFGGTASRPIIRGLDGDRVRIISNGAALSDASSLSFDHAVSDSPLASERVEIVRGPQSLVYSGFAAGGLVQTIDNRITKSALFDAGGGQLGKAQASMGTGSQERLGAALVETGTDKFALHVDGFARRAGEVAVPKTLNCTQGGVTRTTNRICNSQAESRGGWLDVF